MNDTAPGNIIERLNDAVKPLDDLPPSIQSMQNIRIADAAHEAAALIAEMRDALAELIPCVNKWSTPAANHAVIRAEATLAKVQQ